MARRLLLATLIGLMATACAPGRVADLRDSGRLSLGLSLGLSADAKLGALTHPSLGLAASSAMIGFEDRRIEGWWYEARVSEPFATFWYRRASAPWGKSLNATGWRGTWESLGFIDAVDEIDETFDQEPLEETGTTFEGEVLEGLLTDGRWLPISAGGEWFTPLWTFKNSTDLQLGATLLIVGGRVGFNPLEFGDFLAGFAGFDPAGDDPTPETATAP